MKNTNLNTFGGKAAKTFLTLMVLSLLGIASCKKDSSNTATNTPAVTESDAVELTTDAVTPSTGGYASQTSASVGIYASYSSKVMLACGATKDTTISQSSASGVTPSYGYSLSWNYQLNCTNAIPNSFVFAFSGSSNYSGAKLSSNDSSTGGFTLSGLQLSASDYTLNTTYERKGTQTSKINGTNSFNSDLKIVSTNILVDKVTQQIVSGTATITITGTTTSGKSFSYNGTITFQGGKKAILILNSGTTYTIQWS